MPYKLAKEPYFRIAKRNLLMARLLHFRGFYEGAVFHAYHTFECTISAGIASQNQYIHPGHINKINDFDLHCTAIIAGTQLQKEYASLLTVLTSLAQRKSKDQVRHQALYWINKQEPQNRFSKRGVIKLIWRVRRFLSEAKKVFP